MIDAAQLLLVIIVTVLTTLLVVIGLQVINILKEFKKTLEKINKILDDGAKISESVAKPISDLSGFFKMIGFLVDFVKDRKKEKKEEKEEQEQEQEQEGLPRKKPRRRFFLKEGKKLA